MKKTLFFVLVLGVVAAIGYVQWRRTESSAVQKQTRLLMDTYVTIQVPGEKNSKAAMGKALDRIAQIDRKFNALKPGSPLYQFNKQGIPVTDLELVALARRAIEIGRETEGAFDITVLPLLELWGFYTDSPALPSDQAIAATLQDVDWRAIGVEEGRLIKRKENVQVDLGGIAKGLAVAEAIEVLKSEGIDSALVDAGGDIYAMGTIDGKPWKVGIRKPVPGGGVFAGLDAEDVAVVTSGDYERFFMQDGVRYHHILDPRTGYPARGLVSATVICPDAVRADAYATAFFVMGADRAMEFIEKHDDVEGVLITSKGRILMSRGLRETMETARVGSEM